MLTCPQSCQLDLIKDGGQHYFINVLGNTKVPAPQRTQAAFILSVISNNCRPGQQACLNARMLQICLGQLNEQDSMLRRWVVFALAKFWENYEEAKWAAIKDGAHEKLCSLLQDPVPEVRAAAVYALGTFIGGGHSPEPLSVSNCLILMVLLPNFAIRLNNPAKLDNHKDLLFKANPAILLLQEMPRKQSRATARLAVLLPNPLLVVRHVLAVNNARASS